MTALTLESLATLRETWDFEAKLAAGRDGNGSIPESFWETYSAMANTDGGTIVLGVKEHPDGRLEVRGLVDPDRMLRDLWSALNNRNKVSANVLKRDHVTCGEIHGKSVLQIEVPRAPRQQRPVYIDDDLFEGTFLRIHEGDQRANRDRVRRMVAEAEHDERDAVVVPKYGMDDLDSETIATYRARFRTENSDHPWVTLEDRQFLTQIRAFGRDRDSGAEGLTLAGLLMFGRFNSIQERLQNYFLDYQERRAFEDFDWVDRVYPDGRWSGNLFDFYQRVIKRLNAAIKVPFQLGPDLFRTEQTHAHEAVREALVNALIHADYEGRIGVQVVQSPAGFRFRNPGSLRIPADQIRRGGTTDCRNRILQRMMLHVRLGETAGSGFDRIQRACREQHWSAPRLVEDPELDTVTLDLLTTSLVPADAIEALDRRFPGRFRKLDEPARAAILAAIGEGKVTNRRLRELTGAHPRDLTLLLGRLVHERFLTSHGEGSGKWYTVSGGVSEPGSLDISPGVPQSKHGGWVSREANEARILEFCRDEYRTTHEIAHAIGRSERTIRGEYLKDLVDRGLLLPKFPEKKTSKNQAYLAAKPVDADAS